LDRCASLLIRLARIGPVYMTLAEPSGLMPMETVTPPPVTSKVLSSILFSAVSPSRGALGASTFQPARRRRGSLGPPAFQPACRRRGSMPRRRRWGRVRGHVRGRPSGGT
jgi:hypothetical protein